MAYFHLLFHRISRNLPFAEGDKGAVMKLMLKGFLIGAFMLIPSVSGGTMAMIFGIYEKLLSCISSFSSHKKENFLFLFRFMIGSGASFLLLSRPMSILVNRFPAETSFFAAGAVIGGVPTVWQAAGDIRISPKSLFFLFLGILSAALFALLPPDLIRGEESGLLRFPIQLLAGILGALALVLPGISFSSMLCILGVYGFVLSAVGNRQFLLLLPFGAGVLAGIFFFTRLLEKALKNYPQQTYLVILGFVMASLWDIFRDVSFMSTGLSFVFCLLLSASGFLLARFMTCD